MTTKTKKRKNRKQKILQKESHQSIQVNSKKLPNPNPKNDQTWATKVQHAPQKKRKKIARLHLSCDSYCTVTERTKLNNFCMLLL